YSATTCNSTLSLHDAVTIFARLVCGEMQSENGVTDPLLAVLPPLIHVNGRGGDVAPGLRATVSQVFEELGAGRSGAAAVVTRLRSEEHTSQLQSLPHSLSPP